jgi:hypothetical protein
VLLEHTCDQPLDNLREQFDAALRQQDWLLCKGININKNIIFYEDFCGLLFII